MVKVSTNEGLGGAIRAWLPKAIEASESAELVANSGKVSLKPYPTYSRSVSAGWILDGAFESSHYPEWNLCALAAGEPRAEVMLISDRLLAIPHFSVSLLSESGEASAESRTPEGIAGSVIGAILAPFLMEFRYRRRPDLNDDDVIQSLLKELEERYLHPEDCIVGCNVIVSGLKVEGDEPLALAKGVTLRALSDRERFESFEQRISGALWDQPASCALQIASRHGEVPFLDLVVQFWSHKAAIAFHTTALLFGARLVRSIRLQYWASNSFANPFLNNDFLVNQAPLPPDSSWHEFVVPVEERAAFVSLFSRVQSSMSDESLQLAIRRFHLAHTRTLNEDRLLDLWIVLESLLPLQSENRNRRLNSTDVATAAAYLIGDNISERNSVFQSVLRIQNWRNSIVHNYKANKGWGELDQATESASEIAAKSIRRILENP